MKVSNFHLCIGVPLSFPWVPSSFLHSFILMDRPSFTYLHADNGPIHELRNNLVEKALDVGATHLIMMDTDHIYHPQTITRLLAHRLPIVGALTFRRYPPFDSIMLKCMDIDERTSAYAPIDEWEEGSLVEVDATGAATLMVEMEVFRTLPYPWFQTRKNPDGSPIGEDIGFCQDARRAGYKIFVDTSVPSDHLTTMAVSRATNQLYRAMKCAQETKAAALGVRQDRAA